MIVISGVINMSDMFVPFTSQQKKSVLDDVTLKKVPGLEIKVCTLSGGIRFKGISGVVCS